METSPINQQIDHGGRWGVPAVFAVAAVLGLSALGESLPALLALAALAAIAGLLLTTAVVPHRVIDLLYLGAITAAAFPLDKYFGYQDHVGGWPGMRLALSDLFLLLLSGAALVGWLAGRTHAALPRTLWIPYLLLMAQYGFSTLGAVRPDLSMYELAGALHALAVAALVGALFQRRYLGAVVTAAGLMVTVHTAFAVVQAATGRPIGAGLVRQHSEVMAEVLSTGSVRLRPSGLFDHPIIFADFVLLSLPILAVGALALGRRAARRASLAAFGIGLVGLLLTLSRGAWFSALVAAVVFVGTAARLHLLAPGTLRRWAFRAAGVALLLGLVFGPRMYERITESQSGAARVRVDLDEIALSMIAAHPFFGVGVSNFVAAMPRYDPKNVMSYFPAPAHNLYLLEASEAGIPGLLLFLMSGAGLFFWAYRRLPKMKDAALRWLALALLAGMAGFAVSQFADFSHRLEPLRTVLWTQVGLLAGAVRLGMARGAGEEG